MSEGETGNEDLARPSLGDRLKSEREAKGLSVAEAAERLHLRREQVNALESSQFDYIKGDVFVRGYLKAYARLLGLDPDDIVGQYERLVPSRFRRPLEVGGSRQASTALPSWLPAVAVGVVVVVVVALLAMWMFGGVESPPAVSHPPTERAAPGAVNDTAPAAAPAATAKPAVAAPPTGVAPAPGAATVAVQPDTTAKAPAAESGSAQAEAAPAAAPSETAGSPAPVPPEQLTLHFTASCWVEVRDASRKLLAADLKHAGDTLVLDGEPPYRVLLGYAPGVSVTLGGKPVSIRPEPGKQSAKLTIGEQP